MKELERVRGERDVYRSKLQSIGENTDAILRTHREKEKRDGRDGTLRTAASHTHLRSIESGGSNASHTVLDPKGPLVRTHSDDTGEYVLQCHLESEWLTCS